MDGLVLSKCIPNLGVVSSRVYIFGVKSTPFFVMKTTPMMQVSEQFSSQNVGLVFSPLRYRSSFWSVLTNIVLYFNPILGVVFDHFTKTAPVTTGRQLLHNICLF